MPHYASVSSAALSLEKTVAIFTAISVAVESQHRSCEDAAPAAPGNVWDKHTAAINNEANYGVSPIIVKGWNFDNTRRRSAMATSSIDRPGTSNGYLSSDEAMRALQYFMYTLS